MNPASPSDARTTFVAVSDLAGRALQEAAVPRPDERRAAEMRLHDEALKCAVDGAPLLLGAAALAMVGVVSMLPDSAWRDGWLLLALLGTAAWSASAWPRLRGRTAGGRMGGSPLPFARLGIALMFVIALLPWLPGSLQDADADAMASQGGLLIALGAVALGGAMVFAPMRDAATIAVLLPFSALLAERMRDAAPHAPDRDLWIAALLLSAIATALAAICRRSLLRRARRVIANEDRIAELEAARDAAERADQDKSRFLAVASHDLRQPVHALGLFAATLEKRLKGSADEPLMRNIVRSIDGLDRSFNAMLDISRLDSGTIDPNFQHFPVRDLFRRLHMHFAGQAEMAGLNLRFSPGGKSVTSDPQLLERIVSNLIQNAIKYTEHGGVVVVARSTETHFNIEIWDTGPGIRAGELPRIFDEFYQTGGRQRVRAQGLGMGLAIVKRLTRLLGHSLTVMSQPGRGTMFRIGIAQGGLPQIQDATAPADTLPMAALQPRTVLIVDDEEAIRDGLLLLLEEWGYQVIAASSADQARHLARTLDMPPDMILSDLHLGDGPDGIAVIESVRSVCGCEVPAILITGDTSHEEMRRAAASGHQVLFKPVQPHKLLTSLRGLVA